MKRYILLASLSLLMAMMFSLQNTTDLAADTLKVTVSDGQDKEKNKYGNMTAVATSADEGLTLKWEKVAEATGYIVCRLDDGKFCTLAVLSQDARSYTDTEAVAGEEYTYGLIAKCDGDGDGQNLQNYKLITAKYLPDNMETLKVDDESDTVKITMKEKTKAKEDTENVTTSTESENSLSTENSEVSSDDDDDEEDLDKFEDVIDYRLEDTTEDLVIEADVKLSGTGSGYHAKIVMGTSQSAVSFGIQYDVGASSPYTGKTMAILENIKSNNSGEQTYPRFAELEKNRTYRLMLAIDKSGSGKAYINGQEVGTFYNPYLVSSGNIDMWAEGAARLTGDSVDATFSNVRARKYGTVVYGLKGSTVDDSTRENGISCYNSYGVDDLTNEYLQETKISGVVHGITDWDASYDKASSLAHVQF